MKRAGFTLVEIAVVFTVMALVAAISIPIGLDSYRHYILGSETKSLLAVLRRAQTQSMANSYDGSFGVKLQSDRFTLFRGKNFAGRNAAFDEDYLRSSGISISGFDEIDFSPLSGTPNATATITVSSTVQSMNITINSHGTISW